MSDLSARRRAFAAATLTIAFLVDVMNSTSVFAAGPSIERSIGMSQTGLQWTFTAATLPAGALLIIGGRLADRVGRRRVFAVGLGLLVIASVLCAAAQSLGQLLAGRTLQGVAGALLMPAALSLLLNEFPSGRGRAKALATWSAVGGVGATAGLLLGGSVAAGVGWPWVFWVNVILGSLLLAISPLVLREGRAVGPRQGVDALGAITSALGLGCLIYAVTTAPQRGWLSPITLVLLMVGIALVLAFVRIESRSADPMLPLCLLRTGSVLRGNVTLVIAGMSVDGLLFTLTLYTQGSLGYSAFHFAAVTALMTASSVGAAYVAEQLIARVGTAVVARAGLVLLSVTCLTFAAVVVTGGSWPLLSAGMLVFGAAMGCAYTAGSIESLTGVSERESGTASAVQAISFTLGATLGVALLSTVATSVGPNIASSGHGSTDGLRAAFVAGAALAIMGLAVVMRAPAHPPMQDRDPQPARPRDADSQAR